MSSTTLLSLEQITLYYRRDRSYNKHRHSTSFRSYQLIDVNFTCNGSLKQLGMLPARRVESDWWKLKIPKKRLKNILRKHLAHDLHRSRQLYFELNLVARQRDLMYVNQSILYTRVIKKQIAETPRARTNLTEVYTKCVGKCCVQPLTIDFDQLDGYDWVIYPRQYVAYYCAGGCNVNYMSPFDIIKLSAQARITQLMLKKKSIPDLGMKCTADETIPVPVMIQTRGGELRRSTTLLSTITSCKCT